MKKGYYRRVGGDERGLWHEYEQGGLVGYPWSEITRILGEKRHFHSFGRSLIVLIADHESGHYTEFNEDEEGFDLVVRALPHFLSGIENGWLARVAALQDSDPSIVIWQRSDYPTSK